MANAEQQLALLALPLEGRTLGEFVKDLVGPVAWPLLLQMTGEGERPTGFNGINRIYLGSDPARTLGIAADNPQPYIAAVKACLLLPELWNGGGLVARGRRDDCLAPAIEIRPPTDWTVVVLSLTRNTIMVDDGPGKWNGPKIYDLRFFPSSNKDSAEVSPEEDEELSDAANWIIAEAQRLKTANKIPAKNRKTKAAFAKFLADRMHQPAKHDRAPRPVKPDYIRNHLSRWHLWPIDSIE
jgi:hypothetical protein